MCLVLSDVNDVGKNNSKEALKHLCDCIKNNQEVKSVVMTALPRHDLLPSSCVNSEVLSYNKQLRKRMKQYNNVKILETALLQPCGQRCCRLPSVALVVPLLPFPNPPPQNATFTVCRGWRYCPAQLPSIRMLLLHGQQPTADRQLIPRFTDHVLDRVDCNT
jgi:hypothetical protein